MLRILVPSASLRLLLNSDVMPSTPRTYDDVRAAFDSGAVISAPKEELEQLLIAVGKARILNDANQARAAEMGETMRQLLAARQSQEMHGEALRISKVALLVSVFALVAGLAGAAASLWSFAFPSPTQVYSVQTNPVHVVNSAPQPPQTESKKKTQPQSKTESPTDNSAHGH